MPPEPSTPPRWARIVALWALTLALLEILAQVGLFAWAGRPYRSLAPYIWSPYGLVRANPDLTSPRFQHNANGFRNRREFSKSKPPHTLRVMILGGSTMYSGIGGAVIDDLEWVTSDTTVAQYLEAELRADPELAGLNIEVINAALNFHRIPEVVTGYLDEWATWDPDLVIVGGSANNFAGFVDDASLAARGHSFQGEHPWRLEFERQVNRRTLVALLEKALLVGERYSAALAVLDKAAARLLDQLFARSEQRGARAGITPPPPVEPPPVFTDWTHWDAFVDEYLGFADAMAAMAARRGQHLAFFWEYLLSNVGDVKPLSDAERVLYQRNSRSHRDLDVAYDNRARDRVSQFCAERGATFIDPLDALRTHRDTVYIDYLHYTRDGNRFMAHVMYDRLRDPIHRRAAALRR